MTDLVFHFILFAIAGVGILLAPLVIGYFVRPKLPTEQKDAIYECGEPTIGTSYIQFDLRFYTVALLFIIFDVEVAFFFPWAAVYGGTMQLADERLLDEARIEITEKLLNKKLGTLPAGQEIPSGVRSLGLQMQESEDGKSVKVARVENDSLAEAAGLKIEDQIIALKLEDEDVENPTTVAAIIKTLKHLPRGTRTGITVQRSGREQTLILEKPYGAYQIALMAFVDILVFFGVLLVGFAYVWKRGDLDWVRAVAERHKTATLEPKVGKPVEQQRQPEPVA